MPTPITIVTGYLGSGKTTLLRHLLENATKKLAIVMNEFGEIDIDAKVISGKNVNIAELKGGCVCCSVSGEFELAAREIIEKAKPEHIVVEATGVVDPESLIYDVLENMPFLKLDGVVCVVDCDAMARYPEIGETAKLQIRMADILLLNKKDLVNKEQLSGIERKLRSENNKAHIQKAIRCDVPADMLFGARSERDVTKHAHRLEDLETFSFETDEAAGREKFETFLSGLANVFRAKGFVNFPDGTWLFNYVNGRWDFEKWKKRKTELVFIGRNLAGIRKELNVVFG